MVGFDGIDLDRYVTPQLTTVAQPIEELGEKASALLLSRISNPQAPTQQISLPVELVVRSSTAAVKVKKGASTMDETRPALPKRVLIMVLLAVSIQIPPIFELLVKQNMYSHSSVATRWLVVDLVVFVAIIVWATHLFYKYRRWTPRPQGWVAGSVG